MSWIRQQGTWADQGFISHDFMPNRKGVEQTAFYEGDTGRIAMTYAVREYDAKTDTNQPYKPDYDYPLNDNGDQVLYAIEECMEYTPAGDEDGNNSVYEYDSGDEKWYENLDKAIEAVKRYADRDESDVFGEDN
jgi:hypothetical protein